MHLQMEDYEEDSEAELSLIMPVIPEAKLRDLPSVIKDQDYSEETHNVNRVK